MAIDTRVMSLYEAFEQVEIIDMFQGVIFAVCDGCYVVEVEGRRQTFTPERWAAAQACYLAKCEEGSRG